MSETDRRNFLKLLGVGAGVGAIANSLPASIVQALEIPANKITGTIKDVKHIVILMQENRSFDHYFGTLKGVRGFGDRNPVPMVSGPVWQQSDGKRILPPFHLDTKKTNAIAVPGTPHGFADSQAAWNQGKFGFWPKYKNPYSMGYYRREDIPFQFALAEAFTICDAYHCSITTGTDPNRIVFWSGSNHDPKLRASGINGTAANSEPNNLRCWVSGELPDPGYIYQGSAFNWPTIPDVLENAGVSWKIYQDPNDNWTGAMHGGLAFASFRNAKKGEPLYEKGMTHFSLEQFAKDVQDETLPEVSWILPNKEWSEHPSTSTPLQGAEFTARILNALTANPKVWGSTIFFQTFDENDGQFDHVPPPAPPSYDANGAVCGASTIDLKGFYFADEEGKFRDPEDTISGPIRPWGLSARVPMYIVSPWSKGGWVHSEVADHTSVAQFIEKRFGVVVPAISPWQRAICSDLTSAFNFANPNDAQFPKLPETSNSNQMVLRQIHRKQITPPDSPQPLVQEEGVRASRALPYNLEIAFNPKDGGKIEFINKGTKGAVFQVYNRLNLAKIPYRYTVEARKSISDTIEPFKVDSNYNIWILGPNGFNRTLIGNLENEIFDAKIEFSKTSNAIALMVENLSKEEIEITFDDTIYHAEEKILKLAKGVKKSITIDIAKSGNWYDFRLVSGETVRSFAGRYENGKDLTSDPAPHSANPIEIKPFVNLAEPDPKKLPSYK